MIKTLLESPAVETLMAETQTGFRAVRDVLKQTDRNLELEAVSEEDPEVKA